jgi:KDO2-lipid IV(A) lauroyltransferase
MTLGQHTPEKIGQQLAWWISGVVSRLKPQIYHIVHANLSQVLGSDALPEELARTARQVFYFSVRSTLDLFRSLRLPAAEIGSLVDISDETRAIARTCWDREGGSLLVFPHLSSFDLGGHALTPLLPRMQLFTLPDPPLGFQILNETRRLTGTDVTPLSSTALRQAIKLLRRGGVVSVAGDLPVSGLEKPVPFFGRPARVPSGHIRMALKTDAAVIVTYCVFRPDSQRYTIHLEPPMQLVRTGDRREEIQINLRRILESLEAIIRRWPEQWLMFAPVWPELLEA